MAPRLGQILEVEQPAEQLGVTVVGPLDHPDGDTVVGPVETLDGVTGGDVARRFDSQVGAGPGCPGEAVDKGGIAQSQPELVARDPRFGDPEGDSADPPAFTDDGGGRVGAG